MGGSGDMLVVNIGGHSSITGGAGLLEVDDSGTGNAIAGGTGPMIVRDNYAANGGNSISGGNGTTPLPLGTGFSGESTAIVGGPGDTITGGTALTYIDGSAGGEQITGGSGTATGTVEGQAGVNTAIVGGSGDTIMAGAGATYVDARSFAGPETVIGGTGALRVLAGDGDSITGGLGPMTVAAGGDDTIAAGAGTLQVNVVSTIGNDTIDLSAAGRGAAILRDVDKAAGGAATTVVGFSTATDTVASNGSVDSGDAFLGSSTVTGGNTVLTFLDGATMTLTGVTTPGAIHFTQ